MDDFIAVAQNNIGGFTIDTMDARELHSFLEVKDKFATWITRRISKFGFTEGSDYVTLPVNAKHSIKGLQVRIDYHISIDMVKKLAMVENNKRGNEVREWFIKRERDARELESSQQPQHKLPQTLPEALRSYADALDAKNAEELAHGKTRLQLEHAVEEKDLLENRINIFCAQDNLYTTTEFATMIGIGDAVPINLFLRDKKIIAKTSARPLVACPVTWFKKKETDYYNKYTGEPDTSLTWRLTPAGLFGLHEYMVEHFVEWADNGPAGLPRTYSQKALDGATDRFEIFMLNTEEECLQVFESAISNQ